MTKKNTQKETLTLEIKHFYLTLDKMLQVENDDEDGKTSPNLHRRNFLKFSIQNILSAATARERQDDLEDDDVDEDEDDDRDNPREQNVRIVRPLVTNW